MSVDALKGKLKERIETSQRALKERQKAQVMKVAADAIVELQSYGVASTADKFLEQIKQEVAESKAAVEVATGGIDTQAIERDRTSRKLKAAGILQQFEAEMGISAPPTTTLDSGAERRQPGDGEARLVAAPMAPPDKDVSAGSILRELIVNQYQAIVLGGTALVSLIALNPLPLLFLAGIGAGAAPGARLRTAATSGRPAPAGDRACRGRRRIARSSIADLTPAQWQALRGDGRTCARSSRRTIRA